MTPLDCCREVLAKATSQVAASLPPSRTCTLLALIRAGETMALVDEPAPAARPGWNLALRLCLERPDDEEGDLPAGRAQFSDWTEQFLADCDQLALAQQALMQCELGHLQLQQRDLNSFAAWATSRHLSTEQRERADFDWWSAHVAQQVASRLTALSAERPRMRALLDQEGSSTPGAAGYVASDPVVERYYRDLGQAHLARFACQHSYPAEVPIGGATFGQYAEILALLIGWLYCERDRRASDDGGEPTIWNERGVTEALSDALDPAPASIGSALQHFILERGNAAYHSVLPGRAAPPLIRLDEDRVVLSALGLLGEPLIFLTRELRRRHAQEYHNNARLREEVFRQDLYRLLDDKRFAVSTGRVELKRSGKPRTDIDAVVFDRKMGALGVFELKAQDPFARSVEERLRQRDNFFHANRQVSAILEWVQRYGADDLLMRFDERAAKRFHVQKVYIFVLGRYLAHFSGGPEPDRRAAWGSWPQVLQLFGKRVVDPQGRDPLGTLFTRLRDAPLSGESASAKSLTIAVGDFRLRIFPSFAAMRAEEGRPV